MRSLRECLPKFYEELTDSLENMQRTDILEQMSTLAVDRFTNDESAGAIYIYTGGQRELNQVERNVIGVKHEECVSLSELEGMIVIDVDNFGRVMGIEVLDRPDVAASLAALRN